MNGFHRRGLFGFVVLLIGLLVAACGGGGGGGGGTGSGSPGITPKDALGEINVSVDGGPEIIHHVLLLDVGAMELPEALWGRQEHFAGSEKDWEGETTRINATGYRSKDAVPDEGIVHFLIFLNEDDEIDSHDTHGELKGSIGRKGHEPETIINGEVTLTKEPIYHADGIHMDISGEFTAGLIPTSL